MVKSEEYSGNEAVELVRELIHPAHAAGIFADCVGVRAAHRMAASGQQQP